MTRKIVFTDIAGEVTGEVVITEEGQLVPSTDGLRVLINDFEDAEEFTAYFAERTNGVYWSKLVEE